jgi:DNA adenine methylase
VGARPFVKWVGGKRALVPRLLELAPSKFGTYREPFVGGGAMFFGLLDANAGLGAVHLSDANRRLVRTWRAVRDSVDDVIAALSGFENTPECYYRARSLDIDACPDAEVAAWFIYLNRIGFNGLYRVNRQNRFNVAFGRYKNPTICDTENLRAVALALRSAVIDCCDFRASMDAAEPGDFLYCDPPYVPLSATSSFTGYTCDGFGDAEQVALRDAALQAKQRGVHVLLSNSGADRVRELYADGFEVFEAERGGRISCKGDGRGAVRELIIR